jgi:NDP-sugar pyrophosphorylase family protein
MVSHLKKKIKSKNFLLLNGDAIFNFNIEKIFKNHEKKKMGITFLSSEIIYQYGTVGVLNNKVVDFKRNIVYDAIKTRFLPKYTAYNYTGMSIIKTDLIRKYKKNYMNSKNFEQSFFPRLIKKTPSKLIKTKGFWHSIDNLKDLFIVDQKKINPKKFNQIKKIKKFLK